MSKFTLSTLARMLVTVFFVSPVSWLEAPINAQVQPRITGTYSDMRYLEEAGDVLGTEIKIVYAGGHYQGALQFAEGAPEELMVVNIESKGNSIQFAIPDGNPYAGNFTGKIENGWLRGEFRFKSGGEDTVALHRGKSYWD